MAEIHGLTPDDVKGLENYLRTQQATNPDLNWEIFPEQQTTHKITATGVNEVSNEELVKKIDKLNNKINQIFGNSILIKGKFVELKV